MLYFIKYLIIDTLLNMIYNRFALLIALFILKIGLLSSASEKPDLKPYALDNATYANLD